MEQIILIVLIMFLCYTFVQVYNSGFCPMCGGHGKHREDCPMNK